MIKAILRKRNLGKRFNFQAILEKFRKMANVNKFSGSHEGNVFNVFNVLRGTRVRRTHKDIVSCVVVYLAYTAQRRSGNRENSVLLRQNYMISDQ